MRNDSEFVTIMYLIIQNVSQLFKLLIFFNVSFKSYIYSNKLFFATDHIHTHAHI